MKRNDYIVKERHRREAFDKAARRGNFPDLKRGPGHTCKGSIFDCNRDDFQNALSNYWSLLFVGWNPYKKNGEGCWEVWQRPIKKRELNSMEHWVADLDYLNLDFIDQLRRMDAWEHKDIGKSADEEYDAFQARAEKEESDNIKYVIKHNKALFGQLKNLAADGYNPLWFFSDNKQGNKKL